MKTAQIGSKTLFKHQQVAVDWMIEREKDVKACGGFLCDEMGLGKTWSMLGLIKNNRVGHTLVIGPLAVLNQWSTAATSAGFGVYRVEKGFWTKVPGSGGPMKAQVFIVNYDKLSSSPSLFKDRVWHRIICDEAHIVRNYDTNRYKALAKVQSERWWFLSGTPIVNKQNDLVSLLHLMCRPIAADRTYSLSKLSSWFSKYALQRTVNMIRDALPDMPADPIVKEHILPFDSPEEAIVYRAIQGVIADQLKQLMESDMNNMSAILLLLLRMRQISVHPQVYINAKRRELGKCYTRADWTSGSTKSRALTQLIEKEEKGCGWTIFCNFHDEIDMLSDILKENPSIGCIVKYDGSMNNDSRQDAIDKTIASRLDAPTEGDGRHTVFLVQILCGGTGLNLQHMNRVVFMSPWWTAALMDQAVGRVFRMGQTDQVVVHHIRLEEEDAVNIDDLMMSKVIEKRELCAMMLDHANHDAGSEPDDVEADPTN